MFILAICCSFISRAFAFFFSCFLMDQLHSVSLFCSCTEEVAAKINFASGTETKFTFIVQRTCFFVHATKTLGLDRAR